MSEADEKDYRDQNRDSFHDVDPSRIIHRKTEMVAGVSTGCARRAADAKRTAGDPDNAVCAG